MKVLKTHLTKVINELLSEPTVEDVLDHMRRDLREVGVEDFGIFRFTYEGLPLEKWMLGARRPELFAKHVYKGDFYDSPVVRHCGRVVEPFFWYDTPPVDAKDAESLGELNRRVFQRRLLCRCPARRARLG